MTLDLPTLRRTYHDLCAKLRADPRQGLPSWTLDLQPGELASRPVIGVATENLEPALEWLDRHANVVGIVNDFKVGTAFGPHRCITTAEMIERGKRAPGLILLDSTVNEKARRHFGRAAAQNGISALSLLDYYRALRIVDGIRVPVRPFGLLECHDLLAFFDAALELEDEHERVASRLDGDYSRATLYALLLQRLTGDIAWHQLVNVGNLMNPYGSDSYIFNARFFELSDHEVYVDAGAYRGDTVDLFARSVQERFERIHAFEPDPVNFAWLEAVVMERFGVAHPRVRCHRAGVFDRTGTLRFRALDAEGNAHVASYFEVRPDGGEQRADAVDLDVVALDDRLAGEHVTFIKLEVEGSELAALRGARGLILEHRPKLALSAYHRAHDLVDIFGFVESLDRGYRIGLAHHKESMSASVYYAVPPR
jgi:FkbM family methyltransferase